MEKVHELDRAVSDLQYRLKKIEHKYCKLDTMDGKLQSLKDDLLARRCRGCPGRVIGEREGVTDPSGLGGCSAIMRFVTVNRSNHSPTEL